MWKFNGSEIKTGDNVKVSYGSNVAKLLLIPAKRANVGKYSLSARTSTDRMRSRLRSRSSASPAYPGGPWW